MRKFSYTIGTLALLTLMIASTIQPVVVLNTNSTEAVVLSQEFTPARILFDESHVLNGSEIWAPGNASLLSWMLGIQGYNSSTNFDESLDSGILDDYDVLAIFFPQVALSIEETEAIQSFVDNGGGLLLVGVDNVNTGYGYTAQHLNPISETYGIEFNEDHIAKIYDQATFISHHLGQGDADGVRFGTVGEKMYACSLTVSGSATAVVSDAEGTIVAVAESGLGRVVCVGGPAPFYMYNRIDSRDWDYEKLLYQFSLNVFDWLTENDFRVVSYPDVATITVGPGPNLNQSELEEYTLFVGSSHVHTSHSADGVSTPLEQVEEGVIRGLEFIGFADHSHNVPVEREGITGGLEAQEHIAANGFDLTALLGAELSGVIHTVGIGMTENVFTGNQQEAVDQLHAQGALAVLAHPPYGAPYGPVFADRHVYGYDAFEVSNAGYFYGIGETGIIEPFYTGSDAHVTTNLIRTLTGIYVKNPSGPNGGISNDDIKEAILDRRIVVLDKQNSFVYGEEVWVNRFMDQWDQAEEDVDAARTLIDGMIDDGYDITLSELYLERAEDALEAWSVSKAMKLAVNATSSLVLGLDIDIPSGAVVEPDSDMELTIPMSNNHTFGVSINATIYEVGSMQPDSLSETLESAAESVGGATWTLHTDPSGIIPFKMILHSFNTSAYLIPLLISSQTVIDNATSYVTVGTGGYDIEIRFNTEFPSSLSVSRALLHYDDGTGEVSEIMDRERDFFVTFLDSIPADTNISFYIEVRTFDGNEFILKDRVVSTPSDAPFVGPDIILIGGIIGCIAVAAIVIIVVVMKKK